MTGAAAITIRGTRSPRGMKLDGRSFVSSLTGAKAEKRQWIYSQRGANRTVRDKRFKANSDGGFFDLKSDPAEKADLRSSAEPEIVTARERLSAVLKSVPADFLVLSGDDALTLPAMAVGARGVVSVASNEVPGEMARLVEAAERNDFAAAREIHSRLLPLMLANFAESNPIPVKAAMAHMGLLEENYRLPMVPPGAQTREKLLRVLAGAGLVPAGARV